MAMEVVVAVAGRTKCFASCNEGELPNGPLPSAWNDMSAPSTTICQGEGWPKPFPITQPPSRPFSKPSL